MLCFFLQLKAATCQIGWAGNILPEEHSCWKSLNLLSESLFTPLLQSAVCWLCPSHPKGFPAALTAAGNQSTGLFFQGIQHVQLQGSGGASKHGLDQGSVCAAGGKDATNKGIPSARLCTEQAGAVRRWPYPPISSKGVWVGVQGSCYQFEWHSVWRFPVFPFTSLQLQKGWG